MLWYSDGFEFPSKKTKINQIFSDEIKNNKNYNDIIDIQEKFLSLNLEDEYSEIIEEDLEMEISDQDDIDQRNGYFKRKKRKDKSYKKKPEVDCVFIEEQ